MGNEFKDRLRECMEIRNIKPVELSEKTGLSKPAISHYMSGYSKPKSDKLYIIANALNVNETWLMGYDVAMERNVLKFDTRVDDTPYNRALQKLQDKKELTSEEIQSIKDELPKALQSVKDSFSKAYNIIDDANKNKLINYYDQLNEDGKIKLIERAEELTYIPKYCKETPEYLQPVAAHNDYANDEEEQRLMQEDLDDL